MPGSSQMLRRKERPRTKHLAPRPRHVRRLATPRPGSGSRWARGWPARNDACWSAGQAAARAPRCGSSPLISWTRDPQLADVTAPLGGRLPVWVSFPYWTTLIAREPEGVSLPDCVRRWLGAYGQAELWPLVEKALADDRLLLIVDGLDEWTTENAARTAAHLLQVYVQADGIPVLAAGRPHGVRRLELRGGRWNVAEIAELDARQQRQVARVWAQIRLPQRMANRRPLMISAVSRTRRAAGSLSRSGQPSISASSPRTRCC